MTNTSEKAKIITQLISFSKSNPRANSYLSMHLGERWKEASTEEQKDRILKEEIAQNPMLYWMLRILHAEDEEQRSIVMKKFEEEVPDLFLAFILQNIADQTQAQQVLASFQKRHPQAYWKYLLSTAPDEKTFQYLFQQYSLQEPVLFVEDLLETAKPSERELMLESIQQKNPIAYWKYKYIKAENDGKRQEILNTLSDTNPAVFVLLSLPETPNEDPQKWFEFAKGLSQYSKEKAFSMVEILGKLLANFPFDIKSGRFISKFLQQMENSDLEYRLRDQIEINNPQILNQLFLAQQSPIYSPLPKTIEEFQQALSKASDEKTCQRIKDAVELQGEKSCWLQYLSQNRKSDLEKEHKYSDEISNFHMKIQRFLGEKNIPQAQVLTEKSLKKAQSYLEEFPKSVPLIRKVFVILCSEGDIHAAIGNTSEAEKSYRQALKNIEDMISLSERSVQALRDKAGLCSRLSSVCKDRPEVAFSFLEESLNIYEELITRSNRSLPNLEGKAFALRNLMNLLQGQGKLEESFEVSWKLVALHDELVDATGRSLRFLQEQHDFLEQFVSVLRDKKHLEDAVAKAQICLKISQELSERMDHSQEGMQYHARSCCNLGNILNNVGRFTEAIPHLEKGLSLFEKLHQETKSNQALEGKAACLEELAKNLRVQNEIEQSYRYFLECFEIKNQLGKKEEAAWVDIRIQFLAQQINFSDALSKLEESKNSEEADLVLESIQESSPEIYKAVQELANHLSRDTNGKLQIPRNIEELGKWKILQGKLDFQKLTSLSSLLQKFEEDHLLQLSFLLLREMEKRNPDLAKDLENKSLLAMLNSEKLGSVKSSENPVLMSNIAAKRLANLPADIIGGGKLAQALGEIKDEKLLSNIRDKVEMMNPELFSFFLRTQQIPKYKPVPNTIEELRLALEKDEKNREIICDTTEWHRPGYFLLERYICETKKKNFDGEMKIYNDLSSLLAQISRAKNDEEVKMILQRAEEKAEKYLENSPDSLLIKRLYVFISLNFGQFFTPVDSEQALQKYEKALQLSHEQMKNWRTVKSLQNRWMVLNSTAIFFLSRKNVEKAFAHYKEGLKIAEEFLERTNQAQEAFPSKILSLLGMAEILKKQGKRDEAFALYEKSLAASEIFVQNANRSIQSLEYKLRSLMGLEEISPDPYKEEKLILEMELMKRTGQEMPQVVYFHPDYPHISEVFAKEIDSLQRDCEDCPTEIPSNLSELGEMIAKAKRAHTREHILANLREKNPLLLLKYQTITPDNEDRKKILEKAKKETPKIYEEFLEVETKWREMKIEDEKSLKNLEELAAILLRIKDEAEKKKIMDNHPLLLKQAGVFKITAPKNLDELEKQLGESQDYDSKVCLLEALATTKPEILSEFMVLSMVYKINSPSARLDQNLLHSLVHLLANFPSVDQQKEKISKILNSIQNKELLPHLCKQIISINPKFGKFLN